MKKVKIISSILAISMLSSGVVFAQNYGSPVQASGTKIQQRLHATTSAELGQRLMEQIRQKNMEISSTTARMMQRLTEKRNDEKRKNILNNYTKVLKNLVDLSARVESRITKLEADGADMSAQKVLLTTAKASIEVVKTDLETFTDKLGETTSSSTRKSIITSLKTYNEKIMTDVKKAHADIVKVIIALRPGQAATSTKNSTSTN